MEQDFYLEADSHLTAQIILHLRWYLKALYCSGDLKTIQGVPTRFLRILYFNTRSYVTLQFTKIHQLKNQVKIEVKVLDLLQIPTV